MKRIDKADLPESWRIFSYKSYDRKYPQERIVQVEDEIITFDPEKNVLCFEWSQTKDLFSVPKVQSASHPEAEEKQITLMDCLHLWSAEEVLSNKDPW